MKPKWLLHVLAASFAIGALAGVYWSIAHRQAAQADPAYSSIQQAVARLGSLTVSVSGSGELAPASTVGLGFEEGGVLEELLVKAGDEVSAGDLLARLRVEKSSAEYTAELAAAELKVIQAQQALDDLYKNAQMASAEARLRVEQAGWALEDIQHDELERALARQAIAEAQEAIETAEMKLYILNSSPSEQAIYTAYSSLLFKQKDLKKMEKRIARLENQIKNAQEKKIWEILRRQLKELKLEQLRMQADYEKRLYRYEHMRDPADPLDLAVAEAQLATAQQQLAQAQRAWEAVQNGPNAGEIATAQADLLEAEASYARLKDGPDPQQVAELNTKLEIAKAQLAEVQAEQLILELVAPVDGTVLAVDASAGDRITSGKFITLADLKNPAVEITLDETDLREVQAGDKAEIVFDALPDEVFSGVIALVDPSLVNVNNTSAGRAWAQVDANSLKSGMLPVGLSASVDIITGEVDESVLVPVDALRQDGSGGYAVYVLRDGAWELTKVSVGLLDLTTAEILEGLQAGDIVAIGDIDSINGARGIQ